MGVALGVSDVAGAGLHVGAQIGVSTGNRSSPVKVDEPIAIKAVNSLQFGPPDSMDLHYPGGFPSASFGLLEVQQSLKVGMIPSDKSVDYGSLGSQMACPVPSPIFDGNEVAGSEAQNPVFGPLPPAPASVSWASIVSQQQNQGHSSTRCRLAKKPLPPGRARHAQKPQSSRAVPSKVPSPVKEPLKPSSTPSLQWDVLIPLSPSKVSTRIFAQVPVRTP
ncbi:hypothetical protein Nepgr_027185 [Nepenthes gracilis]|uniref:Uncharacterized protein n=1 Tax=Nepenthes gracilis TaxID=150966 RepID=A0AAD3T9L0_NEPGR|nr:hypothetical protein Nepgr_027185 [Nepenthes gracilis]